VLTLLGFTKIFKVTSSVHFVESRFHLLATGSEDTTVNIMICILYCEYRPYKSIENYNKKAY
jgi:hypothetical protein